MTKMKDWKVGASTACVRQATPQLVRAYAEAGLEAMEISLPWDRYGEVDFAAMAQASRETGVELWSLHLPYDNAVAIAHADPAVRQRALAMDSELIRRCGDVGIRHCVIHPGTEPTADLDRPARLAEAAENLHALAELALKHGVTLCVEELPRTCPGNCSGEMAQLLAAHPALRSCFDTNHLLRETHEHYLRAIGPKVVTLHVSDYDFVDERHQLPGEGSIGWKAIIAQLEALDYAGPWMYELSLKPSPGRRTGRELTLRDLADNYKALCAL